MNANKLLWALGRRIYRLRKLHGITQEQLSSQAGIDRAYMGRIERGEANPSIIILYSIAKSLNISIDELVRDTNKEG